MPVQKASRHSMTILTVAVYEDLATAKLVGRTLEAADISPDAIHLLAHPDLVPPQADLTTRDRLMRLGVPENEAQILADMVQGGAVLIAVATPSNSAELARASGILLEARPAEPLASFDTEAATNP